MRALRRHPRPGQPLRKHRVRRLGRRDRPCRLRPSSAIALGPLRVPRRHREAVRQRRIPRQRARVERRPAVQEVEEHPHRLVVVDLEVIEPLLTADRARPRRMQRSGREPAEVARLVLNQRQPAPEAPPAQRVRSYRGGLGEDGRPRERDRVAGRVLQFERAAARVGDQRIPRARRRPGARGDQVRTVRVRQDDERQPGDRRLGAPDGGCGCRRRSALAVLFLRRRRRGRRAAGEAPMRRRPPIALSSFAMFTYSSASSTEAPGVTVSSGTAKVAGPGSLLAPML
jgi:hypothetical protein